MTTASPSKRAERPFFARRRFSATPREWGSGGAPGRRSSPFRDEFRESSHCFRDCPCPTRERRLLSERVHLCLGLDGAVLAAMMFSSFLFVVRFVSWFPPPALLRARPSAPSKAVTRRPGPHARARTHRGGPGRVAVAGARAFRNLSPHRLRSQVSCLKSYRFDLGNLAKV